MVNNCQQDREAMREHSRKGIYREQALKGMIALSAPSWKGGSLEFTLVSEGKIGRAI